MCMITYPLGIVFDGARDATPQMMSLDIGTRRLSDNNVILGGPLTFLAIVKWNTLVDESRLFDFGVGEASDNIIVSVTSAGMLEWSIYQGSLPSTLQSSGAAIVPGLRYFIVVTVSEHIGMTMYINGAKESTGHPNFLPLLVERENCYLGKSNWAGMNVPNLAGEITSFKVYSGAMTETQVLTAYESEFLILEYDFDFQGPAVVNTVLDGVHGVIATLHGGYERTNTGVIFQGVDGYADVDLDLIVTGGPLTIEVVVKYNELNSNSRLFDCGNGATANNIILANTNTNGKLQLKVFQGSSNPNGNLQTNGVVVTVGTRYHIVATIGVRETIYVNGVEVVQSSIKANAPRGIERTECFIGKSNNNGGQSSGQSYLSAEVSSFKLYSGVMSPTKVQSQYTATAATWSAFTRCDWDFRWGTSGSVAVTTTSCAAEFTVCTCDGTVSFGAGASWVEMDVSGTIECTNAAFGRDPILGTVKSCTCSTSTGGGVNVVTDSVSSIDAMLRNGSNDLTRATHTANGILLTTSGDGLAQTYRGGFISLAIGSITIGGPTSIVMVLKYNAIGYHSTLFDCATEDGASGRINRLFLRMGGQANAPVASYMFETNSNLLETSLLEHTIIPGVRYHVTATVEGNVQQLFINGILIKSTTHATNVEPALVRRDRCYIGRSNGVADEDAFMSAEISSFQIYSGALTQDEIVTSYQSTFPILEYAWDFRDFVLGANAALRVLRDSVQGVSAYLMGDHGAVVTSTGVSLNGTEGSFIDLELDMHVLGGAMTIEIVARFDALNSWSRLFACANGPNQNNIYLANDGSTSALVFGVIASVVGTGLSRYPGAIDLGVRYHFVATAEGSTMRTYMNGALVNETTDGVEPNAMTRSQCYIGKSNWGHDEYLAGEVTYLKIYSGAMQAAQVTRTYEAAFPILEVNWDFTKMPIPCTKAQFLYIDGGAAIDQLNLYEVVVKGTDGAQMRIVSGEMSSIHIPHSPCGLMDESCRVEKCFDGITSGNNLCHSQSPPWFAYFDLGEPKCIATIELFNRDDTICSQCPGRIVGSVLSLRAEWNGTDLFSVPVTAATQNGGSTLRFSAPTHTYVDSVKGLDATLSGGAARGANGVVFDGVNGFADLNLDQFILGGPVTIVIVASWSALTGTHQMFACAKDAADLVLEKLIITSYAPVGAPLSMGSWSFAVMEAAPGNGFKYCSSNTVDLYAHQFYQLIVTVDSSGFMKGYVNGTRVSTNAGGNTINPVARANCYIGRSNVAETAYADYVDGAVASFQIYTGVMDQAAISSTFATYAAYVRNPTSQPTSAPIAIVSTQPTAAPSSAPSTAPSSSPSAAPTLAPTSAPTTATPTFAPTSAPSSAPTQQLGSLVVVTRSPLVLVEGVGTFAEHEPPSLLLNVNWEVVETALSPTEVAAVTCTAADPSVIILSAPRTLFISRALARAHATAMAKGGAVAAESEIRAYATHDLVQGSSRTTRVTCDVSSDAPGRIEQQFDVNVLIQGVAQPSFSLLCTLPQQQGAGSEASAGVHFANMPLTLLLAETSTLSCGATATTNGNSTLVIIGGVSGRHSPQPPFDESHDGSGVSGRTSVRIGGVLAPFAAVVPGSNGTRVVITTPSIAALLQASSTSYFRFGYYGFQIETTAGAHGGALSGSVGVGLNSTIDRNTGRQLCAREELGFCPDVAPASAGLFYTEQCAGYGDASSDVRWAEKEFAILFAYGRPPSCRPCPEGCLCPGGSRCRPWKGYYVPPSEAIPEGQVTPTRCAPPAELRCIGWSLDGGTTECGIGFEQGSTACGRCAKGYYKSMSGCDVCPAVDVAGAVLWPALANVCVAVAAFLGVLGLKVTVSLISAKFDPNDERRRITVVIDALKQTAFFTVATVAALQLLAAVVVRAEGDAPETFKLLATGLGFFLFEPPNVKPECVEGGVDFGRSVQIGIMVAALICVVLDKALQLCPLLRLESSCMGWKFCSRCEIGRALRRFCWSTITPFTRYFLSTGLTIVYVRVVRVAIEAVDCSPSTEFESGWSHDVDTAVPCYDEEHVPVVFLAVVTIGVVGIAWPFVTILYLVQRFMKQPISQCAPPHWLLSMCDSVQRATPSGWLHLYDDERKAMYFSHCESGAVLWERPSDGASAPEWADAVTAALSAIESERLQSIYKSSLSKSSLEGLTMEGEGDGEGEGAGEEEEEGETRRNAVVETILLAAAVVVEEEEEEEVLCGGEGGRGGRRSGGGGSQSNSANTVNEFVDQRDAVRSSIAISFRPPQQLQPKTARTSNPETFTCVTVDDATSSAEDNVDAPLPSGWELHQSETGRAYFYCDATQQTTWLRPGPSQAVIQVPLPRGWTAHRNALSREYYHNDDSGETTWNRPSSLLPDLVAPVVRREPPPTPQQQQNVMSGGQPTAESPERLISSPKRLSVSSSTSTSISSTSSSSSNSSANTKVVSRTRSLSRKSRSSESILAGGTLTQKKKGKGKKGGRRRNTALDLRLQNPNKVRAKQLELLVQTQARLAAPHPKPMPKPRQSLLARMASRHRGARRDSSHFTTSIGGRTSSGGRNFRTLVEDHEGGASGDGEIIAVVRNEHAGLMPRAKQRRPTSAEGAIADPSASAIARTAAATVTPATTMMMTTTKEKRSSSSATGQNEASGASAESSESESENENEAATAAVVVAALAAPPSHANRRAAYERKRTVTTRETAPARGGEGAHEGRARTKTDAECGQMQLALSGPGGAKQVELSNDSLHSTRCARGLNEFGCIPKCLRVRLGLRRPVVIAQRVTLLGGRARAYDVYVDNAFEPRFFWIIAARLYTLLLITAFDLGLSGGTYTTSAVSTSRIIARFAAIVIITLVFTIAVLAPCPYHRIDRWNIAKRIALLILSAIAAATTMTLSLSEIDVPHAREATSVLATCLAVLLPLSFMMVLLAFLLSRGAFKILWFIFIAASSIHLYPY